MFAEILKQERIQTNQTLKKYNLLLKAKYDRTTYTQIRKEREKEKKEKTERKKKEKSKKKDEKDEKRKRKRKKINLPLALCVNPVLLVIEQKT